MSPTTARRFLIASLVLAAGMQLPSCAAMPDAWGEHATRQPLPAVVMRVSTEEVQAHCQSRRVMGCAIRDYAHGVCTAYVDVRPLPETIPHELLHCAGYDHE